MVDEVAMRKREEAAPPQDMLARLRDAKITKTEISSAPTTSEEMKRTVTFNICRDFFSVCSDAAKKEGKSRELEGTQMKQFFG
jgi:hypothetical protein